MARKNAEFYFEVLGVEPNSTNVEIKNAYIKLIKKWHPDRFPNDFKKNIEATEKSKLINEAYHFLKKIYDLEGKKTTENAQSSKTRADNFKKHDIKMMKVKSSNIHSIGYDKIENILQVQFLHGTIYEYFKVPESVFNELMNAESKGKYATKNIFFKYQYKVVG